MSTSPTTKQPLKFLQRIVPLFKLGSTPVNSRFVTNTEQIEYGTDEWRHAVCRLYRNLRVLHDIHIENPTQREFGNRFIKTEFKRSKQIDEAHALKFYKGWVEYGVMVEQGAAQKGRQLTEEQRDMLNEDQKGNLTQFRSQVVGTKQNPDVPGGVRD